MMTPYEEAVILRLNDFSLAEVTEMPKMLNGETWVDIKKKIEKALKNYFGDILKERKKN